MSQENPYSPPTSQDHFGQEHRGGALVPQVRIVAILMIIQGVLEMLFGIYYLVLGFVMPNMMASSMANQPNQPAVEQLEMLNSTFFWVFFAGGMIVLLIGLLRLVAGIMGVSYRGRTLGIITHIAGFLTVVTCYCLPTALGIGIYGCIVYFNGDVAHAFRLRKNGQTSEQILGHFGR